MPAAFTESAYENALIQLFQNMVYRHLYDPDIDCDYSYPFEPDLDTTLHRLNPPLPEAVFAGPRTNCASPENASLTRQNEVFTDYLQNGVPGAPARRRREALRPRGNPDNNAFAAANQWTFVEDHYMEWKTKNGDYEDTRHTRFGTFSCHNYPPEGMEEALRTVMMQCELGADGERLGGGAGMSRAPNAPLRVDFVVALPAAAQYNRAMQTISLKKRNTTGD